MNNQKIMRVLFLLVPVLLLLSIWWHVFAPFLSLALVYLMLLVLRNSGWVNGVFGKRHGPSISYQPQQQEPLSQTSLTPSFDLTPQEYQQLSQQYQQGYLEQTPHHSPNPNDAVLKEAPWQDDKQPQDQHPQEMPQIQYSQEMPPFA